ncbi:MAG: PilZ domain-containing protein [Phycisphaerales bacterium]|nr:PilZ domain-containing protein [Phycisphaerales bacterium]
MSPLPAPPSGAQGENARRHGRVVCQHLTCSLGVIVNLSASGLSARASGRPMYHLGEPIVVTVNGLEGAFDLPARVVWIRKAGFLKHEVGITFLAVSDQAKRQLLAMGRCAASNETIGPAAAA